jgi:hypothetical protein
LFARDGYKFEDALTVTGLEDVPDGQSVRGGLTANSVRNKVADYFLTDTGASSWRMSKIRTVEYIKYLKKCMNFNQLCSVNYGNIQQKRLF